MKCSILRTLAALILAAFLLAGCSEFLKDYNYIPPGLGGTEGSGSSPYF